MFEFDGGVLSHYESDSEGNVYAGGLALRSFGARQSPHSVNVPTPTHGPALCRCVVWFTSGWLAGWLRLRVACLHIAVDWLWMSCLLECLVFMCWRAVVIVVDYSPKCAS